MKSEFLTREIHCQAYPVKIAQTDLGRARDREIGYLARLELRPGRPVIAVGVWDEISGTDSLVENRVLAGEEVKKAPGGR